MQHAPAAQAQRVCFLKKRTSRTTKKPIPGSGVQKPTVPEFEQTGLFTGYHPLKKMIWFLRISLKLLRSEYRDSD